MSYGHRKKRVLDSRRALRVSTNRTHFSLSAVEVESNRGSAPQSQVARFRESGTRLSAEAEQQTEE